MIRAELDCLCPGLSMKIASGTLYITQKREKLMKSSFKIWRTYVMATDYKKENKKYLVKLLTSIFNSARKVKLELEDNDDAIWDTLQRESQILISQDCEEDEESDEDMLPFSYTMSDKARLKYTFPGFN
jgi:Rad3-related DNA helicase